MTMPFDALLFAQSENITNWLTPVWLISLGIALGFVSVLIGIAKLYVGQKIGFFNSVAEKPSLFAIFGVATGLIYTGLFVAWFGWRYGWSAMDESFFVGTLLVLGATLLLGFGIWKLVSRKMIGELNGLVFDGFLAWLNRICIAMAVFAVAGFGLAAVDGFGIIKFVDEPLEFVNSLARLPFTGTFEKQFQVKPSPKNHSGDPFEVSFDGNELQWFSVASTQRIELASQPITAELPLNQVYEISESTEPAKFRQRADGRGPIPNETIDKIYLNNLGSEPAQVTLSYTLAPIYAEASIVLWIALSVVAIYFGYLSLMSLFPKSAAIAQATFKTEICQPLYLLVLAAGMAFVVLSIYVPYNTFGEDIKMYKDSGLTLIRVLAIFLAIWAASKSVAEEIDGRTALTVLSKPVGRRQFILGKFSGISLAIGLLFIVLGIWFVGFVAYKPIYDFREASKGLAEWNVCFTEAVHVIPGLFLCFLEVLIFVAISVAISTRLGILANFLICFSIYVLGHLTPLIVQSSLAAFEPVQVFGQLVAIVFPVLDHFDVQAAISSNADVPVSYLTWSIIYTALYGTVTLLAALVMFEDRDLA
jgi:ABC-type transport system involved in multi-copper enzyme maturation permease subunit